MNPDNLRVGLFGPDERNPWRKPLVEALKDRNIPYTDPTDYGSEYMSTVAKADRRNAEMDEHFAKDAILVLGSIHPLLVLELESSIWQAIALNADRQFVVLLPRSPFPHGLDSVGDIDARNQAHEARQRILTQVKRLKSPNIHLIGEWWNVQPPGHGTEPSEDYRQREQQEVRAKIDEVRELVVRLYFDLRHGRR